MIRRTSLYAAAGAAALLLALVACEAKKSSNPLSPSVAGPIAGVDISAPVLIEPAQGFKFRENQQPIKLVIENSRTTGVRAVTYTFEVASDSEFNTKVFARSGVAHGDGRTSVQLDSLELGRSYYWRARADDGANQSLFSSASFEMLPRATVTLPGLVWPINNERIAERRPTLKITHSTGNSAVGTLKYFYVVARDQSFTQIVAASPAWEDNLWPVDRDLDYNVTYYWHVRATDGEYGTDWTATQVFRSPAAPAPTPTPSPGPTNPGGPCNGNTGLSIVECERAKYGHMSHGQMLDFARATTRSLNRNGISGAPFGILRKTGGTNCGGYSCDVICAGQGGGQRQWDILGDIDGAQYPSWGGPNTLPNIRVDVCEIQ
jgi:hypothetical protein